MFDLSSVTPSSAASSITLHPDNLIEPIQSIGLSPIDYFLGELRSVITAAQPESVELDGHGSSFLMVRIVGAVETYIRSVLSRASCLCPRANSTSDANQVTLFAARRYSDDFLAMGVLEGTSLADPSEIKKKTKGMLGFEIKNNSPLDAALGEYAKACHVRHAIAHAGGIISARNIIALGVVAPPKSPQRVQVTVTAIQDVAAICETVVRSYNQYAFESILGNWLGKSLLVGDWRFDQELVKPLFRLFYSSQDGLTPKTAYGLWRRLPRIH